MPFHTILFLIICSKLLGIKALQCQLCSFPENSFPEWCTTMKNTSTMTCDPAAGATTCYIATGIRPLEGSKPPVFAPAVTRHCSVFTKLDTELWKTMAKGQKMVCIELVQTKLPPGPNGMPMIDRRCICAEDNCNKLGWDEVMQQPALPKNYTASDTPQPSQFADYSLAVLHGMLKTNGSNGDNLSDTSHTTTAKSNDTATDASTMAGNSVKDAGGSGSSAGLIAGISIGLVALAAAAGGLFTGSKCESENQASAAARQEPATTAMIPVRAPMMIRSLPDAKARSQKLSKA